MINRDPSRRVQLAHKGPVHPLASPTGSTRPIGSARPSSTRSPRALPRASSSYVAGVVAAAYVRDDLHVGWSVVFLPAGGFGVT